MHTHTRCTATITRISSKRAHFNASLIAKVKDTRQCAHKQLLKGKESRSGRQANYRAVAQYKFNSPVTPQATANGFELVNHWPVVTSQAPVNHTSSQPGKNDVTHDRSRVRTDTRKPHP